MKITNVECLILDGDFPFVRIFTDEGITGIGECFRRQPEIIKTLIDKILTPALVGKDPTDTESRFRDMQNAGKGYEMGGAVWCAIAGLDIALWDIKGKALNQPIWKLLGGKYKDKIQMYASSMSRDMTPSEEAKRAEYFIAQGYSGYKLHSAIPGAIDDPRDKTIDTVTEVRRAIGDEFDILVDVNGAYSAHHAIEIGKILASLGVFHFEEPRPHYDLAGLAQVADALDIPIASGEMIYTLYEYKDLITRGKVDIIQPDIVKAPGFTEFQKIAALCTAFGKPITVHNTQPILSTVAHLHVCAVYEIIPYAQEYNIENISIRDEWPILKNPLQVKNGYLEVPTGPGLGVDLDEKMLKKLTK